jgi:hypothetical protein
MKILVVFTLCLTTMFLLAGCNSSPDVPAEQVKAYSDRDPSHFHGPPAGFGHGGSPPKAGGGPGGPPPGALPPGGTPSGAN